MRISVFGTGSVGTAIASRLRSLGYDVVFGSRHPGGKNDGVNLLSYEDAAVYGDWVVNALHGEDAMDIFPSLDLGGKLLIDLGNFLHSIEAPLTETLGESLQRALPETRVVKAMNFPSAHLMGHPKSSRAPIPFSSLATTTQRVLKSQAC
jgi:predicted dinucleotide-binding enzyme